MFLAIYFSVVLHVIRKVVRGGGRLCRGLLRHHTWSSMKQVRTCQRTGLSSSLSYPTRTAARRRVARICHSQASQQQQNISYGSGEKVIDLSSLLAEVRETNSDFIFTDEDYDEPVWEHEGRIRSKPLTLEELQQEPPPLFVPAAETVDDVLSAYSAEAGFQELTVQQLATALQSEIPVIDLLLDVRSTAEFEAGPTIPSAHSVPLDKLSDAVRAGQLDQYIDQQVAVICSSGQRSAQATVRLSKVFGFQHVFNVTGGVTAWQAMQLGGDLGHASGGGCGCGKPSGGCGGAAPGSS